MQNNMVAKHALTFNKAKVFVDRKKEAKAGGKKFKFSDKGEGYAKACNDTRTATW